MSLAPQQPRCPRGFESINRYWDRQHNAWAAKILPGEFYVSESDEAIGTVLGSCVSACIRDPYTGIGGMNHFMLPLMRADRYERPELGLATRYGNYAMEHLINEIIKRGSLKSRLEVKVFGGGKVLQKMTMDVGLRNVEFVHAYLQSEGLAVVAEDTLDIYPRKLMYWPSSGRVLMKKLRATHNDTIEQREQQYINTLVKQPVSGPVELF